MSRWKRDWCFYREKERERERERERDAAAQLKSFSSSLLLLRTLLTLLCSCRWHAISHRLRGCTAVAPTHLSWLSTDYSAQQQDRWKRGFFSPSSSRWRDFIPPLFITSSSTSLPTADRRVGNDVLCCRVFMCVDSSSSWSYFLSPGSSSSRRRVPLGHHIT